MLPTIVSEDERLRTDGGAKGRSIEPKNSTKNWIPSELDIYSKEEDNKESILSLDYSKNSLKIT